MNIYLIERDDDDVDWDEHFGHVIVALKESSVMQMAINKGNSRLPHSKEDANTWVEATITKLGEYDGDKTEPFIAMSSFNAG